MGKQSAGILFFKKQGSKPEVLLGHPGGPFFSKKDEGVWSIPKGEYDENEEPLQAAIRETEEEIGIRASGNFIELRPVKLKSGKVIHAWALDFEVEDREVKSNHFILEWPPKSGLYKEFPEIDRVEWFSMPVARNKIHPGQLPLLAELEDIIKSPK